MPNRSSYEEAYLQSTLGAGQSFDFNGASITIYCFQLYAPYLSYANGGSGVSPQKAVNNGSLALPMLFQIRSTADCFVRQRTLGPNQADGIPGTNLLTAGQGWTRVGSTADRAEHFTGTASPVRTILNVGTTGAVTSGGVFDALFDPTDASGFNDYGVELSSGTILPITVRSPAERFITLIPRTLARTANSAGRIFWNCVSENRMLVPSTT